MRFAHLNLAVTDVETSAAFWCDHLGFDPGSAEWTGDRLFLRDGDGFDLVLHPAGGPVATDGFHVGFRAGSAREVDAVADRLRATGAAITDDVTEDGFRSIKCLDPDGYEIEVYWEPAAVSVRSYDKIRDRAWAEARLDDGFGGAGQVRKGELIDVLDLDGFVAERGRDGQPIGLLTYRKHGDETELAFMWAFERRRGVGGALMGAFLDVVDGPVWLITTNDNTDALAFYQQWGFDLRAIHTGAVDHSRAALKPQLPLVGAHGIERHDEIELGR